MKTYKTIIKCNNCGENICIKVPSQDLVKDYLRIKATPCSNCNFRLE